MSLDFSKVTGLTIPEGVVTQITDASGRVLWMLNTGDPIILEVNKITSSTYAGSTEYPSEQFVLLDIYPKKSNSTVKVTYGGLTKTLTFSGTNAKQVYFGTFNGVADSVETPASGTLTIEGDCSGFACGVYQKKDSTTNKGTDTYCKCITAVIEWGGITHIPDYAFYYCSNLALTELPIGITSIGAYAFYYCSNLALTELPIGITNIGEYAFYRCENISIEEIPEGVTSIGGYAFEMDGVFDDKTGLALYTKMGDTITLPSTITSIGNNAFTSDYIGSTMYVSYLNYITILATTPPTGTSRMFGGIVKITVPAGCVDVYKAAEGWSSYADKIVEAS